MIRKAAIAALLSACLGSISIPAAAAAVVFVQVAPPPLRAEVIPSPRRGHVWVAGHWGWRNHHHQWVKGTWVRERRGYQYSQPMWLERDGRWHMVRGNWSRADRDGDGVQNRRDHAPDDPRRY